MTVAFESGELKFRSGEEKSREAVLALPLSRLLVRMVRVKPGEDPVQTALPVLSAASPYPDEPLSVACEQVEGEIYIAAALPESSADDIAEKLDATGINVTKVDALCFGEIRALWSELKGEGRKLLLLKSSDCISLMVLDAGLPVAIRALDNESDLKREAILSLLEAEDFGGVRKLDEIVARGDMDLSVLERLAPVRRLEAQAGSLEEALAGIAERAGDESTLNALPDSWRQVLEDTRFKRKLTKCLAVAGGVWALVMAGLLGVPMVLGMMTDYQKGLSKAHSREYRQVTQMRDKVKLVRKYSDHTRGALEIMKAVSDRLPQGIELSSWNYKREDGVKVSGEGVSGELIYQFKDNMAAMAEEDGGEPIFPTVNLKGPSSSKAGKYKFDLDCAYEGEEE